MALILSIDTSLELGAVALTGPDGPLGSKTNAMQNDHAAWIHLAINALCSEAGHALQELSAVAVTSGPGSYTGLRVGMATAKGLCYALDIPLITETTLKLTAISVKKASRDIAYPSPIWICPMIDARRMEVFTTLYDWQLEEKMAPEARILDEGSFQEVLDANKVVFCGNGMPKWKEICKHPNALFSTSSHNINDLAETAIEKFKSGQFAELAYAEPDYFKNFYGGN